MNEVYKTFIRCGMLKICVYSVCVTTAAIWFHDERILAWYALILFMGGTCSFNEKSKPEKGGKE